MTEPDNLHQTLEKARRYLFILEEQAAAYGSVTIPAHLKIELEDKRQEIARIENRLKNPQSTELGVFLCHIAEENPNSFYWDLYTDLANPNYEGLTVRFVEDQLKGNKWWDIFAEQIVQTSQVVLVCLNSEAFKDEVLDPHIKFVLSLIHQQPSIKVIAILLENCSIPEELRSFPLINYNEPKGSEHLLQWLRAIARELGINVTLPQTRHLDAAIAEEVMVEHETELLVMVRLPDSEGLKALLGENSQYRVEPDQVRSKEFDLEFELNDWGMLSPLDLWVEIDSPRFNPQKQRQKVAVHPLKDSEVCHFLLTPTKTGDLTVIIRVLLADEHLTGSSFFRIKSLSGLNSLLKPAITLITISLGVFGMRKKPDYTADYLVDLDDISANIPIQSPPLPDLSLSTDDYIPSFSDENIDPPAFAIDDYIPSLPDQNFERATLALKDEKLENRIEAAISLGKLGDARAGEPLIQALKDESWDVHRAAVSALGKISGARAVERLILALKDEESKVRSAAASVLGLIGGTRAIEPLILTLQDENVDVRSRAAEALGKIGDGRAIEPLILALKDEDSDVRRIASYALGDIADPRAIEPLILALQDENDGVRSASVSALGDIADPRAIKPLILALKDEDVDVRCKVANTLGEIGDGRALPELETVAREDKEKTIWNESVSDIATEAIEKIKARQQS